ncbi:MAG: ATP-dependent zinc metalloprotease FtsH [Candidatus Daviesbacteria bacterium GW2011_GWA1_41_61]|uniref:ATP-dependent zinc metalloprotease FtsH n=1 Tax=Candidatus Daviesbacteria bacterium GW2011_GWA2_40_9 TaxID=1618424 RepID=A0A0G0WH92_9BACT|nr:MAG: ATP-dependent zinc metalloprotease FtsH [Candidatus Daviesbacteria bacterium GW2011_GWC1_40_9]KKR83695.1 MAG: ATP-dependent zinc metalloprotease FtsH [Candidatus Daviesbacteria bacterium GW2011_GWA2_40_9]KKR93709.1 MAG: ATP-dependent zinc metalloprotease FtsH [Candidatus Daviesbacteria bacterium GW2011_GWB1_41_15]KKS15175.1 MAG: ATP-dependent zinc metalloprotease FtsH [Candidatus Daviesbacteria bacterium GW2011_GWA1_41_61]
MKQYQTMVNGKIKLNPKNGSKKMFNVFKGLIVYILVGLAALIFFVNLSGGGKPSNEVPISQVVTDVKEGKVDKLVLENDRINVDYKDSDQEAFSRKEGGESIYQVLKNAEVDPKSVTIEVKDTSWQQGWLSLLGTILPIALMVGFFFLIFRQARDAGQGIFAFGQSRAKVFSKDQSQIRFSDVAGVEEAKKELEEVVDFLKNSKKYKDIGARIPKGVLLVGPPGTGKTLLSRAVAGEAKVPFFSIAGSEFMEMLVGVGAARVRDMFAQAKKAAPSIIFIDEIESIGRMRGFGMSGGHDEREQTLNQILVEMDGFTPNDHVIVIGATNRPDLLDPALVRPGRFDRRVVLNLPDIEERKFIIKLHMKGKPFTSEVDVDRLARRTVGFSGADLANMLNEAAILAARENKKAIDARDLEEAATKVKLGPQRKRMQTEEDRKLTAYHEAGHALVGHLLPKVDPVHRISIVARGMSGGHTMFPPTEDRSNERKSRLVEQITAALGGQAAELMVFGDISTGAASDLQIATNIARDMVTEYGMSDLGPINVKPQSMFGMWPQLPEEGNGVSETMQTKVDAEIKKIIDTAYTQAQDILRANKSKLDKVAKALLEKETLDADEFEAIVDKKKAS